MLGGNFFKAFDEDPFFSGHREHMQRMSEMFNQPFGGIPAISQQSITDGRQRAPRGEQRQSRSMALSPFGMFDQNPFSGFGGMFQNMQNMQSMMMGGMQGRMMDLQNDPNCHSFSSSSVMTYSNTGNGQPEIYQASTSRTTAPGGVREERKAVRDSRSGLERQSVGHHIRDRGHVIERSRNHNTGDREENHNYENLDEDEAEGFHREFNTHMSRHPYNNRSRQQHAITDRSRDNRDRSFNSIDQGQYQRDQGNDRRVRERDRDRHHRSDRRRARDDTH